MKKIVASEILRIVGPEEAKIPATHRRAVWDTAIDIVRNLPVRPTGTSTDGEARQALRYLVWQQDIGGYYYGPYWAAAFCDDAEPGFAIGPGPALPDPEKTETLEKWMTQAIVAFQGFDMSDPAPQMSTTEWLTKIIHDYNNSDGPHDAHILDDRITDKLCDLADAWCDNDTRSWQNWLYVRDTAYCQYTDEFRSGDIPQDLLWDDNDIR